MGYKEIELRVPVGMSDSELEKQIGRSTGLKDFTFEILLKSLDARNKQKICWQYRLGIKSEALRTGEAPGIPLIEIPRRKHEEKVVVAGSGPAGIFAALVLAEAGMKPILIERGSMVMKRKHSIDRFESTGQFDSFNNYSFGEGGAGTFSDGKLTSRTKGISLERNFIYKNFIEAGAPAEIMYMTHPHVGSDNLLDVTARLRQKLIDLGGQVHFDTMLEDIVIKNNRIEKVRTSKGDFETDYLVLAIGHSATETYRMLMSRGVPFQTKNFALGMRAEHPQEIINKAQWGKPSLPGVKAAEYRLTAQSESGKAVYSFCMCPGGIIVPATAYEGSNLVNGMSYYKRNGKFANAAVVAAAHPDELLQKTATPEETLDWLEALEQRFYVYSQGYKAPAVSIADLTQNRITKKLPESSYPLGLVPAEVDALLPNSIAMAMQQGLKQFAQKLKGYEQGLLVGLESKTSSPVQVIRDKESYSCGYDNLYLAGEGSGWAGGIISSAADGIKVAMAVLKVAR